MQKFSRPQVTAGKDSFARMGRQELALIWKKQTWPPREDRTNWSKVDAVTGAKLEESIRFEAAIRADVDEVGGEADWTQAIVGIPARKDHINIRIDHDVLEWFRSNGKGYQTLMNNVLRAFVQTRQQRGGGKTRSPR
jgi:uncharacterized protein (DUF4415 family)